MLTKRPKAGGRQKGTPNKNPSGSKQIIEMTTQRYLEMRDPKDKYGLTRIQLMNQAMYDQVINSGNVHAYSSLLDRGYGRVIQRNENTNRNIEENETLKQIREIAEANRKK